jgi:hypothetical protein
MDSKEIKVKLNFKIGFILKHTIMSTTNEIKINDNETKVDQTIVQPSKQRYYLLNLGQYKHNNWDSNKSYDVKTIVAIREQDIPSEILGVLAEQDDFELYQGKGSDENSTKIAKWLDWLTGNCHVKTPCQKCKSGEPGIAMTVSACCNLPLCMNCSGESAICKFCGYDHNTPIAKPCRILNPEDVDLKDSIIDYIKLYIHTGGVWYYGN